MKRARTALSVLLLAAVPGVWGQESSIADHPRVAQALGLLAAWIDAERAYKQIPGVSVGVVHDQDLIWSGGFGYSDRESQRPATPKTIYSICSISKLFTSIGVMQLRDQGHLSLTDSPEQHLPWFAIEQTYPARAPITIHGILTHSSGLPRESDFPYWTAPDFEFPTRDQVMERVARQETLYPADTYYQYSNLGLTLAGMIVAQVSGRPYDDYVAENILVPLGLADTRPEMPQDLWGGRLATGYGALRRDGTRKKVPFFQAKGIAPAAGYSSTVEDLAKFAAWQFRLLEKGGNEILNANTLREMHRVHWLDPDWETAWGLGFAVSRSGEKTFVGHGGSCPGYRTHLRMQPTSKIATIYMANASSVNVGLYTQRAFEIVAPAISEALESPDEPKAIDSALRMYTGTYSREPWGGEIAVVAWKGGLAMVSFPTDDPLEALQELKHIEGNRFRRIRNDKQLGEEIVFQLDETDTVTVLRRHSNRYPKVD